MSPKAILDDGGNFICFGGLIEFKIWHGKGRILLTKAEAPKGAIETPVELKTQSEQQETTQSSNSAAEHSGMHNTLPRGIMRPSL